MMLDVPGSPRLAPFAPMDWSMKMEQEGSLFTAVVCYKGEAMCRLSMVGGGLTEAAARTQLADRARLWIGEYLARPVVSARAPL